MKGGKAVLCDNNDYITYFNDSLARIIAPVSKGKENELATALIEKFKSVEGALCAPHREMISCVGEKVALYLKTLAAIASRRITQLFEFGKPHTRAEVADYFVGLYIPCETEKISVMLIDADGAVIDCKIVSDGTISTSEVLPRKILEAAISKGSKRVILAHNHPHGSVIPSEEDIKLTACITDLLSVAGIKLEYHVIVAGQEANILEN